MQSDNHIFRGKAVSPIAYEVHDDYMNYGAVAPGLGTIPPFGTEYSRPFQGFELQPSEVCPKNFIIFDQTDKRSRIMYHPALKQEFAYPSPGIDFNAAYLQGYGTREDVCDYNTGSSSSMKEDTKDIDALMSLDAEELEEDDEVISTARTYGNYDDCSSPDSCSNYSSKSSKRRVSSMEKSLSGYCSSNEDNDMQRQRMKKMLKALRRIVPGADNMTTAVLVDEAVTYLKSLKVEAKKLGLGNFKN